jgi:hypothetical protein
MQPRTFLTTVLFAAAVPAGALAAQVSPADRATREGDASTIYPLGRFNARVQTLHADLPASALLRGHAYRRDATALRGQVPAFRTELQVTLATAPHAPAAAKTTFAQNLAGAGTVVLPRTWLSFPATARPPVDPAPAFALVVPYASPVQHPGGTLCADLVVWGNDTPAGLDRTFSPELDAHELRADGSTSQPGFAYGSGCLAPGRTTPMSLVVDLERNASGVTLALTIANAVPSATGRPAKAGLVLGFSPTATPWPARPTCLLYAAPLLGLWLAGDTTATGGWRGAFTDVWGLPDDLSLYLQGFSLEPLAAGYAFSNGVRVTVPPAGPRPVTAARIAHGDDRASATGTVSFVVPVMRFL